MGFIQRRLLKLVMRVVSFPKLTLGICAVLLVAAVSSAWMGLKLSTDQDELLTPRLKFLRDYKDFTRRFPENESFVVIIEPQAYGHPPPARRWMEFADRISTNLSALKQYVRRVDSHVPLDELSEQSLLFAPWEEVRATSLQARDFSRLIKVLGEAPGLDALVLGRNMTERFYCAVAQGPARDSRDFAEVVTHSLAEALNRPAEQWQHGRDIPDMVDVDPCAGMDPAMHGYNMIPDETKRKTEHQTEKILVINVYANRDYSSLEDITQPLKVMRAVVEDVAKYFPEFKKPVITGRPALEADEMATSDRDTRVAEILGLSLVFVALFLFLRNLWLVLVAEICLGAGIGWTFGWATLAVGRLNLLSLVFVIALIGIGMDYLIQILTRYRYEKKRYKRATAVWVRVFRYVSPPISTACAGAAGAFLVAMLTDFRGAAELGLIAGGGLLLCLAAGYTVLPALLTIFPAHVGKVAASRRYRNRGAPPLAGGVRLIPGIMWILVVAGGLWVSMPPQFDPNLLKLQADGLESVKQVRKLPTWYAVILSEDLDKLRKAREILSPKPDGDSTISHTESLLDAMEKQAWLIGQNQDLMQVNWLEPVAPAIADLHGIADAADAMLSQWNKQANAGDLGTLTTTVRQLTTELRGETPDQATKLARLTEWQRAFLRELRVNFSQFAPPPLNVEKLPESLREHLVSLNGKEPPLYALYVYPKADLWENGELAKFVAELEMKTPGNVLLTGIAPQLYHSTLEIHRAFVRSTIYALVLIFILVLLDLRSLRQTLLAISVLALGLPMLLLMMWFWQNWLHEPLGIPGTWNFANFFGLPILIGAGHEYGVFMVHRYREALHDPRRVWRAWDVSDKALLLCAIVTSASFGFLIAAQHHGLASLGWVMCVGTACIYLATILVLRPILQWRLKYKGVYRENAEI